MVKMALDTNTIFDYSELLKEYKTNTLSNQQTEDLKNNRLDLINEIVDTLTNFFHSPVIRNIHFDNPRFTNYYAVNEMYIDMLKNGNLNESQIDLAINQLNHNFKLFCSNYSKLINYDVKSRRVVKNPLLEGRVENIVSEYKDSFNDSVTSFHDISYKYELANLFQLAFTNPPKVELVITEYIESEVYSHIAGTSENIRANELKRKANGNRECSPVREFDGDIIRDILGKCSIYVFTSKAKERVKMLAKELQGGVDPNTRKEVKGVDSSVNSLGETGDPNCVASVQCLGIVYVSRNIKDMKGKGINISQSDYSDMAVKYFENLKQLKLEKLNSAINGKKMTDFDERYQELIDQQFKYLDTKRNSEIYTHIIDTVEKITCASNRHSGIYEPAEATDKIKDGSIDENNKELLGLVAVQVKHDNTHVVGNDTRVYNNKYKVFMAEQMIATQQYYGYGNAGTVKTNDDNERTMG